MKCAVAAFTLAVSVLLLAQTATVWSAPVTTAFGMGTVDLTVEKFVNIRIPDGPGDGVNSKAYGMLVDPLYLGTNDPVQTLLQIWAQANCNTWIRVPASLSLQDHGSYTANALVTVEATGAMATKVGNFWYKKFTPIAPETRVLNATVTVVKHPWTTADLAGYYWQTLWVDIQASESTTPPGGWPVHTEPTVPPHS